MNSQAQKLMLQAMFAEALGFFDEFDDDTWPFLSDEQVQQVIESSIDLAGRATKERDRRKA